MYDETLEPLPENLIAALEQAKIDIRSNARNLDMDAYHRGREDQIWRDVENLRDTGHCNTTHCIAGFLHLRLPVEFRPFLAPEQVEEYFNYKDFNELFHIDYWDMDLKVRYWIAEEFQDHEYMANLACKAIDRFIEKRDPRQTG